MKNSDSAAFNTTAPVEGDGATNRVSSDMSSTKAYVPSLAAINYCLTYSIVELALALFIFALFVNSSILIVAGASLYGAGDDSTASLFSIHALLSASISPAAGTIFALALLLSGVSAGIVCTIAGQMVSEGALRWTVAPWLRRLITRSISITPSIIIAGAIGAEGLTTALNASQVALSIALPFVSAPIIYFTARSKFMTVHSTDSNDDHEQDHGIGGSGATATSVTETSMVNSWLTTGCALVIWLIMAAMNVANLVLLGLGTG
jgi:metal iron transporter